MPLIQIAMVMAVTAVLVTATLQSFGGARQRAQITAAVATFSNAARVYRDTRCAGLPTQASDAQLVGAGMLLPGGTWLASYSGAGVIHVSVLSADTAVLSGVALASHGTVSGNTVTYTVLPDTPYVSLSGPGFAWMETEAAGCGY